MSEFSNLTFILDGNSLDFEFQALLDYCRDYAPEALSPFEKMRQAHDTFIAEGRRLEPLIWALHKDASNDGYSGQVQDALNKLSAPETSE